MPQYINIRGCVNRLDVSRFLHFGALAGPGRATPAPFVRRAIRLPLRSPTFELRDTKIPKDVEGHEGHDRHCQPPDCVPTT
jgi:hypothetical protein